MEQHGAGHGVQVQHVPDALSARLCVLDDVIGDTVVRVSTKEALEDRENEGQKRSLRRAILLFTKNVGWAVIAKYWVLRFFN